MKVKIYKDEMYPFFGIDAGWEVREVSGATVRRWKRVMAAFDKVQREMSEAYERSTPTPPASSSHPETMRPHSPAPAP
jgi:hypothetical protein